MRVRHGVAWFLTALGAIAGGVIAGVFRPLRPALVAPPAPAADAAPIQHDFEVLETVFDSRFGTGWEDWGWGPRQSSDGGALKIGFSSFGGIMFRHSELPSKFGALVFRFRAPAAMGNFLSVTLKQQAQGSTALPVVAVEPHHLLELADGWRQALVPWMELNPSHSPFDRIVIQAREPVSADWVELDKVLLTKPTPTARSAGPAPTRTQKLRIDCRGPKLPINPMIYGISHGPLTAGETAHRIGGNTMTRHNWELGAWNVGSDWFFENVKGENGVYDWLRSSPSDPLKIAIVVPIIGWVAKDGSSVGFPRAKFGSQKAHDPKRPEAGDGNRPDGTPLTPGPPTETSVAAPPEMIRRWIERLREQDRDGRSVDMYILDNEADLWHATHRDVHPEPLSYDELLDRTIRYGSAVRQADPGAVIAGPASWGWPNYFSSPKDTVRGWGVQTDRLRHGGMPLLAWYLHRLAEHEKQTGVRVLDVLDVHFYPQAPGVYQGSRTDPETAALRIRSTRALWDPSYLDESWIHERVELLPRLEEWVSKNYPGRGISLGEWSFGAEEHISGALAIAEALGRFGQAGLSAAFFWGGAKPDTAAFWAFRAYRNFDGQGGRFLDWSLATAAPPGTSLFASRDEAGTRVVAVLLNLDPTYATYAELDVSSCGSPTSKRVFAYQAGSSGLAELSGTAARGPQTLAPPYSINVIDLAFAAPQR